MAEPWIIKFEDADVEDHIFIGDTAEEDSRRVFLSASESWNCHLFGPAEEITLLRQKLATLTASNEALLAQVKDRDVEIVLLKGSLTITQSAHGVTNLRGPLMLKHGDSCLGCQQVRDRVLKAQARNAPPTERP